MSNNNYKKNLLLGTWNCKKEIHGVIKSDLVITVEHKNYQLLVVWWTTETSRHEQVPTI